MANGTSGVHLTIHVVTWMVNPGSEQGFAIQVVSGDSPTTDFGRRRA
jgi:hypothetical protein